MSLGVGSLLNNTRQVRFEWFAAFGSAVNEELAFAVSRFVERLNGRAAASGEAKQRLRRLAVAVQPLSYIRAFTLEGALRLNGQDIAHQHGESARGSERG